MEGNAWRQLTLEAEILLSDLPQELKIFRWVHDCVQRGCEGSIRSTACESYVRLGLPITPKVHVVLSHVDDLCRRSGRSLGSYSEQAAESVHSDFLQTWKRYTLPSHHPRFGEKLLQTVVAYNSCHIERWFALDVLLVVHVITNYYAWIWLWYIHVECKCCFRFCHGASIITCFHLNKNFDPRGIFSLIFSPLDWGN